MQGAVSDVRKDNEQPGGAHSRARCRCSTAHRQVIRVARLRPHPEWLSRRPGRFDTPWMHGRWSANLPSAKFTRSSHAVGQRLRRTHWRRRLQHHWRYSTPRGLYSIIGCKSPSRFHHGVSRRSGTRICTR